MNEVYELLPLEDKLAILEEMLDEITLRVPMRSREQRAIDVLENRELIQLSEVME